METCTAQRYVHWCSLRQLKRNAPLGWLVIGEGVVRSMTVGGVRSVNEDTVPVNKIMLFQFSSVWC